MERELLQVKRGEMPFDRFAYATGPYWRRVAADLLSRWDVPPAVGPEDVVQELLVAVWAALEAYEEGRSSIRSFVLRRALWAVKRWIHQQREAYSWSGKAPSRHAIGVDAVDACAAGAEPPSQERAVEVLETMRVARSARDRAVLERLLARGTIDGAAADLYADPGERLERRFDSEANARRSVYRAVLRMARTAEAVGE